MALKGPATETHLGSCPWWALYSCIDELQEVALNAFCILRRQHLNISSQRRAAMYSFLDDIALDALEHNVLRSQPINQSTKQPIIQSIKPINQ